MPMPPSPPLGEFARIERYFKPLAAGMPGALGLSDDAAVFEVPPGLQLVVTTDAMVAGRHFLADDPPAEIAAKLLRVNLSDLAAMGAQPYGYTLVTSLPRTCPESWLEGFVAGLAEDQARYGIGLLGGDSVSTEGPVTLAVTAFGLVPRGLALTRSGGQPGDLVLVSGSVGDAAAGLALLQGRLGSLGAEDDAFLINRLRRPEPRLSLGQAVRQQASAAVDISDGLVADLGHIAEASGCHAVIEAARLPLSPPLRRLVANDSVWLATALTGGDDYELVLTAPPARLAGLTALARTLGLALTPVGHLSEAAGSPVSVIGADGRPLALARTGWQHF